MYSALGFGEAGGNPGVDVHRERVGGEHQGAQGGPGAEGGQGGQQVGFFLQMAHEPKASLEVVKAIRKHFPHAPLQARRRACCSPCY